MYGIGVAKGLWLTLRTAFSKPITVQFPEEVRPMWTGRARTNLLWFDERCTGCSTCAQACPDGCILVATEPRPDGSLDKVRYEIDFRICMYCGLCTEACPYDAIQPGGTFKDAVYFFDDMYQDKYQLTRLAREYMRTHDNTYPNGMKATSSTVALLEAEVDGRNAPPPAGTHGQIPAMPGGPAPPSQEGMP